MKSISPARTQVVLQVESFVSWDLLANVYSYLSFSKTCVLLLCTWSNLASFLLKSFSDHVFGFFPRESNQVTKCYFFSKIDIGDSFMPVIYPPISDGSCAPHVGVFMGSLTEDSALLKRPILKSWRTPIIHQTEPDLFLAKWQKHNFHDFM